jgi:uncharacterized membrane protein YfcA
VEFAIANVAINPILLIFIGFVVGILGGFFGVGGGFLAGPLMLLVGVPFNFMVGTGLAHIMGKSIVGFRRHRALGNVDMKLGVIMIIGTVVGTEIGAQILEYLEARQSVDMVLGIFYICILVSIGSFTLYESISTLRHQDDAEAKKSVGEKISKLAQRVHKINIPPMLSFPASGIETISLWNVLGVGIVAGMITGLLGVGGGFIRMPLFVYYLGIPTHVAVGTDLFEIIFSAGYGTITHALKGNVDVIMALMMQTGAAVGAQIGSMSTSFFSGPRIRLFFSVLPFVGVFVILFELFVMGGP